jgi:PIN domain nuclease of toxin-antitoxin system
VRLVLDTHTLIWWDDDRLPRSATALIQNADVVFVSAVTAWEIAIKSALGKLVARGTVEDVLADYGFSPLGISVRHADAVRTLAPHHRDPFDRLLIAQAQIEDLAIVTRDPVFRLYDVGVRW